MQMTDVSDQMEGKTSKQLLSAGARAYATSNYNVAVQYLSRASEVTVAENGSHTHDSLGEIYFLYGKSLLELSREEGDPLGDVVPKDVAVAQEAEEEEEDETEDENKEGEEGEESDDDESENGEEGDDDADEEDEEKAPNKTDVVTKENATENKAISTAESMQLNGDTKKAETINIAEAGDKSESSENLANTTKSKDGEIKDEIAEAGPSGGHLIFV